MTFEFKDLKEIDEAGYPLVTTAPRPNGNGWSAWVGDRRNPQYLVVDSTEAAVLKVLVQELAKEVFDFHKLRLG